MTSKPYVCVYDLPWPPSLNTAYPTSKFGRRFPSARVKAYKHEVSTIIKATDRFKGKRIKVSVELFPPTKRKCDIDNFTKVIFDAMTDCGVWEDDSQIYELHIRKMKVDPPGYVYVYVTAMEGPDGS